MRLRTRYRSLFAAFIFGTAMPLVVASSPAEAWVDGGQITKTSLYGAEVATGVGVAKFAVSHVGLVGAVITVGQIGWWAYSHRDVIFHADQPAPAPIEDYLGPAPLTAGPTYSDSYFMAEILTVTGRSVTVQLKCTTPQLISGTTYNCAGVGVGGQIGIGSTGTTSSQNNFDCENTTTHVKTVRNFSNNWVVSGYGLTQSQASSWRTVTYTSACLSGEQVIGMQLGSSTTNYRQHSPMGWGTMEEGGYPSGDISSFGKAGVEVTCKNTATAAVEKIRTTSTWDDDGNIAVPSCKQRLGDDWVGTGVKVIPLEPKIDDLPVDPEVWPDWDVPDTIPEEWTEAEADPEAEEDTQPCHSTKDGCGLTLWIDNDLCTVGNDQCVKVKTIEEDQPSRVKCKWGTVEVAFEYCKPIIPSFSSSTGTTTTTTTGTGTGTQTGTGPFSGPVSQTVPQEATGCLAEAVSWNPVDWIFTPVKCALKWAFKPQTAFETRVGRVKTAYETKPPFSWLTSLSGLSPISGGGCPTSWVWHQAGENYPILCGTAMGNGLHAFRPTMVVLLVGAAVYPFLRALVYAAFPIIKPTPHD